MAVWFSTLRTTIFGEIFIVVKDDKIIDLSLTDEDWENSKWKNESVFSPNHPILVEAIKQLEEYFAQKRTQFNLPLEVKGTDFQQQVWNQLKNIPYGTTCSYGDVAVAIDNEKAVRAVGQANRRNPIPIIIPCHRVIGKNKSLTGYSGTRTDLKEKLLELEGVL
jgi:methylated-DNA-[protein]-cysteine S-methyltransferase